MVLKYLSSKNENNANYSLEVFFSSFVVFLTSYIGVGLMNCIGLELLLKDQNRLKIFSIGQHKQKKILDWMEYCFSFLY